MSLQKAHLLLQNKLIIIMIMQKIMRQKGITEAEKRHEIITITLTLVHLLALCIETNHQFRLQLPHHVTAPQVPKCEPGHLN